MSSIQPSGKRFRVQVYVRGRRSSKTFPTMALAQAWADREEGKIGGLPAMRQALEDHRIASVLPQRFKDAMGAANYSHDEIVDCSMQLGDGVGIYFLISNHVVRYVGQTTNLVDRLARHKRNRKLFDAYTFIPCLAAQLDALEKTYITLLFPEENQRIY